MTFIFGKFELDEASFELRAATRRVNVQPKVLRLLLHLVANRERAVSTDELLKVVWQGEAVTLASVKRAIQGVRRALGDSGDSQSSIRTVRGRGYQFVLPVSLVGAPAGAQGVPSGDDAMLSARAGVEPPSGAHVASSPPGARSQTPVPRAALVSEPAPHDPFVGRAGVLGILEAKLADVLAGRGGVVLVVGEPGIGKTRTLLELAARATSSGADAWLGRCLEEDGAPAFWPWLQILRECARSYDHAELLELMGPGAADIAEAIPALRQWLPQIPSAPAIDAATARFRFFDSFTVFLKRAAERRPVVLVFDDLQRADQPTLLLLSFLVRQLDRSRILIAGSFRPTVVGAPSAPDLMRTIPGTCVELEGLSTPEIAQYLELRTGARAPDAVVEKLHQQTAGNPLFLQEILQGFTASTGTGSELLSLTSQVRGLSSAIERHLEALSTPCLSLLRAAAVLGREFGIATVAHMLDTKSESILPLLGEAIRAGVVREGKSSVGRHRFTHALIRDALYGRTPIETRAGLHARAGLALEARGSTSDPSVLSELAHHFSQAAPAYEEERALRYVLRAAESARQCMAYEEAAAFLDRALELCEGREISKEQRMDLMLRKGEALAHAVDAPGARAALREAMYLARELGNASVMVRAAMLFARPPESGAVDWTQVEFLREALSMIDRRDPHRASLEALLARCLSYTWERSERDSLVKSALARAQKYSDTTLWAQVLFHCHEALGEPDYLSERIEISEQLARLGQKSGDHRILIHAAMGQVQNNLERGNLNAVEHAMTTLEGLVEHVREPYFRWHTLVFRATRASLRGDLAQNERYARQALEIGLCVGESSAAHHFYAIQVAGSLWIQGRLAEVDVMIRDVLSRHPPLGGWRALLACIWLDMGKKQEAKDSLNRLMGAGLDRLTNDPYLGGTLPPLADLCAHVGTAEMARSLYDVTLPYDRLWGNTAFGISSYGPMSRCLGVLAMRMGDARLAERHLQTALAEAEREAAPIFIASTCMCYARLLMKSERAEDTRIEELLRRAYWVSHDHGFTGLATACRFIAEKVSADISRREARPLVKGTFSAEASRVGSVPVDPH